MKLFVVFNKKYKTNIDTIPQEKTDKERCELHWKSRVCDVLRLCKIYIRSIRDPETQQTHVIRRHNIHTKHPVDNCCISTIAQFKDTSVF